MIKRFTPLVFFIGLGLLPFMGMAQCTPVVGSTGLVSPDDMEGIPSGFVGQNYSTTITVNIPTDTTFSGFPLSLDSVVLTEVNGLPNGFTYTCNPSNCQFPSGQLGCVEITGFTDEAADEGDWELTTTFQFYGKQGSIPLSYPYTDNLYTLTLEAEVVTSNASIDASSLKFSIGPNPVTKLSRLIFELPQTGETNVSVYNLVGSTVYNTKLDGLTGENSLRMSAFTLDAGIYFIELSQGDYIRSARFVIQD